MDYFDRKIIIGYSFWCKISKYLIDKLQKYNGHEYFIEL